MRNPAFKIDLDLKIIKGLTLTQMRSLWLPKKFSKTQLIPVALVTLITISRYYVKFEGFQSVANLIWIWSDMPIVRA